MPIVFKSNGTPTCCGERINHSGYCILCGEQYDIKELQDAIVRRIEINELLSTLENKGSNV
jgi:hypothetical protein